MSKYKIIGTTIQLNPEIKEISKVVYARFKITFLIKTFLMRFLYDWVEVEEGGVK